jgi:hypothetical protein
MVGVEAITLVMFSRMTNTTLLREDSKLTANVNQTTRKSPTISTAKPNTKIVSGFAIEDVTIAAVYATAISQTGTANLQTGQILNRIGDI